MLVSELAGKASLVAKAASLGVDLAAHPEQAQAILDDIKAREAQGYSYEVADGSLAVLLQWHLGTYRPHFTLESFRVIVDDHEDTGARAKDAMSEATIKIHVGDERFVATGEGTGPVGALDNALRLAITQFFPEVAGMELVDYNPRRERGHGRHHPRRHHHARRRGHLGNHRRLREHHRGVMERTGRLNRVRPDENGEVA